MSALPLHCRPFTKVQQFALPPQLGSNRLIGTQLHRHCSGRNRLEVWRYVMKLSKYSCQMLTWGPTRCWWEYA